jgi:endonuclease/exonuclease/phosphatase family metal-dependent hydrolase
MATKLIPNDNISKSLEKLIGTLPKQYKDSDKFLDVISWNLRWFNHREEKRVDNICTILGYLNADIFIFQEVENGSLEIVKQKLSEIGAGFYETFYGTTGGGQRIAFMWDTDWVRAKDNITELFGKRQVLTGDNKDVFPRLPLWGHFLARPVDASKSGFTFQLVGLHLKSQMNDFSSQRKIAAESLAYWLQKDANDTDADSILIGDWNKNPIDADWEALHQMETAKKIRFKSINDSSDFSHLYYENKHNLGSRLDMAIVSTQAYKQMAKKKTEVIRWATIDDLISSVDSKTTVEIKKIFKAIKEDISDHMPLFCRYYSIEK